MSTVYSVHLAGVSGRSEFDVNDASTSEEVERQLRQAMAKKYNIPGAALNISVTPDTTRAVAVFSSAEAHTKYLAKCGGVAVTSSVAKGGFFKANSGDKRATEVTAEQPTKYPRMS